MTPWGLGVCALQLALVMLLSRPPCAHADEPRVTVVAEVNRRAILASHEVEGLARAALAESTGFRFQDAERLWRGDVASAQAAYARLLRQLKRGRQAYLALELESAVSALEAAVAELPDTIPVLDSPERGAEVLMYLGASHVLMGDQGAARRVFARYHVQFGDIAPDDTVFNPQIMAHWEAARRDVERSGTAALTIEGPEGAVVFVDGRARGGAGIDLSQLRAGEHWVRVSRPFEKPFVARVTLEARDKQRLVAAGFEAQMHPLPEVSTDEGAMLLARALEVDVLGVFAIREEDGGALRIGLSVRDGATGTTFFQHEEGAGPDLVSRSFAVRRLVAMLLDQTLTRPAPRPTMPALAASPSKAPPPDAPPKVDEAPTGKRRIWLWAAAGSALALAAGATVLFIARDKDEPRATSASDRGTIVLEF